MASYPPLVMANGVREQLQSGDRLVAPIADKGGQVFNVKAYGALGDGKALTDGAMTASSATLTSATAAFTAADVGKNISVSGAGAVPTGASAAVALTGTISAYVSATQVTLSAAAGTTVSGAALTYGTDDAAAIQAAIDAAALTSVISTNGVAAGGGAEAYAPAGRYLIGTSLVLKSFVTLRGAGTNSTMLQQAAGTNFDLIVTESFATLANTNTATAGVPCGFAVRDLRLVGASNDRDSVATSAGTLSAGITSGSSSFSVQTGQGSAYPSANGSVRIGTEVIHYSTRTTDTFSGLTRGGCGTTAASHSGGDVVTNRPLLTISGLTGDNALVKGAGLRTYGYGYRIENVAVHGCRGGGAYSEWATTSSAQAPDSMEARWVNVKLHDAAENGLDYWGPHDSQFVNVIAFNNGLAQLRVGADSNRSGASCAWANFHAYGAGVTSGTYGVELRASGQSFTNLCAESVTLSCLYLAANDCQFANAWLFDNNSQCVGLELANSAARNTFLGYVKNCNGGAVVFTSDGGNNSIQPLVSQTGGTVTSGTPAASTSIVAPSGASLGLGTLQPNSAYKLHLYGTANQTNAFAVDCQGTGNAQQAGLDLLTKGDGTKSLGNAATKGWSFVARGDAYATAAQQNSLLISSASGATFTNFLTLDAVNTRVGIGTNTAPETFLHVQASLDALSDLNVVTNYHLKIAKTSSTNSAGMGVCFGDGTGNVGASIVHEREGSGSFGNLRFCTKASGGSNAEKARITSAGTLQVNGAGANGQSLGLASLTELTTVAAAATTDTAIQLPAGAIILAVSVRVTTVIPTATTFSVGDSGSATRFSTANVSVAANSTDRGTAAGAYYNASATAVRLTMNGGTPANNTGRVRVTIYYLLSTPPTS